MINSQHTSKEIYQHTHMARLPIFDKKMTIYGYELVSQKPTEMGETLTNQLDLSFLSLRFEELSMNSRIILPYDGKSPFPELSLIPYKNQMVVEFTGFIQVTNELLELCYQLKNSGLTLMFDASVLKDTNLPLRPFIDVVNIRATTTGLEKQRQLINLHSSHVKFLAKNLDTKEDFDLALSMGFDLFQGAFFMSTDYLSKDGLFSHDLALLCNHLTEGQDGKNVQLIESNPKLTFKLLKIANSHFYQRKGACYTISQVIQTIGISQIKRWIGIFILRGLRTSSNHELIRMSLVRGKVMELLAQEEKSEVEGNEAFFTGVFSLLPHLLGLPIENFVEELPGSEESKLTLLGGNTQLRGFLDFAQSFEMSNINSIQLPNRPISQETYMTLLANGLEWVLNVERTLYMLEV